MKKTVDAILFDLDQTLVDFLAMKRYSCRAAIHAMIQSGLHLKPKQAEKQLFELYDRFGIEDPQIFQRFLRKTQGTVNYRLLSKAIAAYRKAQPKVLIPYPNTRAVLLRLQKKGLKLGIVSDAPRLKAWTRLAEMELEDFFETVIGFEDTKKLKPNPAPFKKAVQKLKTSAYNILFVGDNPQRDIAGAAAAGMKTCWAQYGYPAQYFGKKNTGKKKISPDYKIGSFAALEKLVQRINSR
ncbi:MAG: HAD-IA family hydrolase [Candidatus Diapherotrites archaeon]|uniref:HAD-IA family hydrolase n=1 Tax=Candidatus Iainarchaeum sp. TaxID=3101447 RepID=A0A8T4L3V2_9ARCH|nr:HAD-IA family hydrolase [Candidatus Diapherotrites archaeon]